MHPKNKARLPSGTQPRDALRTRASVHFFRQQQATTVYTNSDSYWGPIFWAPEGTPEWSPTPSRQKVTLRASPGARGRPRKADLEPPGPPRPPKIEKSREQLLVAGTGPRDALRTRVSVHFSTAAGYRGLKTRLRPPKRGGRLDVINYLAALKAKIKAFLKIGPKSAQNLRLPCGGGSPDPPPEPPGGWGAKKQKYKPF